MKKIFILLFLLFPSLIFAQGLPLELNYFGYSPASSNAVKVSAFEAVYQEFKPYNDYLNGVDIWADNAGSSGSASFSLLNSSGDMVVSKNISIPNIPIKWGGEKIRISFTPVKVLSNEKYRIKISSPLSKFQMYYAYKTDLLEHNAPFNFSAMVGNAYLGNAQQEYAFKFSLYENGDNLPPIISNVSFSAISETQMRIDLNSNEPVDIKIDYQTTFNSQQINDRQSVLYSGDYKFCIEGVNTCGLLFNAIPNMTYTYQLYVTDFWGNQTFISGAFESSKTGIFQIFSNLSTSTDSNTPTLIVSNLRTISLTPYSAKFAWSTNMPSPSRAGVSLDFQAKQVVVRLGDNTFELEHTLDTGNFLSPNTHYFVTVIFDNYSSEIIGETIGFTTPAQTQNNNQPPPPLSLPDNNQFINTTSSLPILTITTASSSSSTNSSIIINWQTPISGHPVNGYRVDIFDSNNNLIKQLTITGEINNISVSGLSSGEYRAIVYANNNGVFEKVGKSTDFSVKSQISFSKKFNLGSYKVILGSLIFIVAIAFIIVRKRKIKNEPTN